MQKNTSKVVYDLDNFVVGDNGSKIYRMTYSDNTLLFSRRLVRQMARGTTPIECINHEVIHANDYFTAAWFNNDFNMNYFLNGDFFTTWMELRALSVNVQNSSFGLFHSNLKKFAKQIDKFLLQDP